MFNLIWVMMGEGKRWKLVIIGSKSGIMRGWRKGRGGMVYLAKKLSSKTLIRILSSNVFWSLFVCWFVKNLNLLFSEN